MPENMLDLTNDSKNFNLNVLLWGIDLLHAPAALMTCEEPLPESFRVVSFSDYE